MATDPIVKDHQLWIGFVQPEGLVVSPHALKNAQAVLSRSIGVQQKVLRRHTLPGIDKSLRLKDFPAFTREFWDWRESDLATPPDDLFARLGSRHSSRLPTSRSPRTNGTSNSACCSARTRSWRNRSAQNSRASSRTDF